MTICRLIVGTILCTRDIASPMLAARPKRVLRRPDGLIRREDPQRHLLIADPARS
jgi:hypothetical protein